MNTHKMLRQGWPMHCSMRMMQLALVLLTMVALPGSALAWNDTGHSVISTLVYRELTPETRAKLDTILKAHPRYTEDLLRNMPEGADAAKYAFMKAATWPDMIRDKSNPMSAAYHKGPWHYTDVPYYPNGGEEKYKGEPAKPTGPGEPYDSISAWEYNVARLNDEKVAMSDRAIALCWVLHLGGDIHQPCHNVSMYSDRFPAGDKGGNNWTFMDGTYRTNLHAIWDGLLGRDSSVASVEKVANEVAALKTKEALANELKVTDVRQWVQEGRFIAVEHVYLNGKLVGPTRDQLDANRDLPIPQISVPYMTEARKIGAERALISSYRLTATLNGLSLAGVAAK